MRNLLLRKSMWLGMLGSLLLLSCTTTSHMEVPPLIPQPLEIVVESGSFDPSTVESVALPTPWYSTTQNLIKDLAEQNAIELKITEDPASAQIVAEELVGMAEEEYELQVGAEQIRIWVSTKAGYLNAMQTVKQFLLQSGPIPQMKISDQPRFAYRGLMLDCSRHFWTVDEIKESIRQMALFKLNKLHLHLTDNNAWRVEIKAYPKLITSGTHYDGFPELSDKYYTQDELRDIVAYAAQYNIEVIPEIDVPGHAIALLAAYPELSCHGGEYAPYPEEMPANQRKYGSGNMLCVGNPEVYTFMDQVIKEVADIFPSKNLHLGGDEVPTKVWQTCDKCKALHHSEKMSDWGEVQDYFTREMAQKAKKYGKTMLGWDEINERHAATPDDMVMVWRNHGFDKAVEAMERDIPIIMAPQHGCYYDWGYAGNATRKVYEWDPISEEMALLNKDHLVKGGQACLWTERVANQDRVEEMLYPRLTALAEVLWTAKEKRNWDDYLQRLENFYPLMEQYGINYFFDDAINEEEFKPKAEKPALLRHAQLSTNVPYHGNYHLEYLFDGKSNTFYWGGRSIAKGDWYQVSLGEPVSAAKVEVITGDSKDYINHADLMISEDGEAFEKVGEFDSYGKAEAKLEGRTIRAVRIEVSQNHNCWPVIKEVKIEAAE